MACALRLAGVWVWVVVRVFHRTDWTDCGSRGPQRDVLALQQRTISKAKPTSSRRLCAGRATCLPDPHDTARAAGATDLLPTLGLPEWPSDRRRTMISYYVRLMHHSINPLVHHETEIVRK